MIRPVQTPTLFPYTTLFRSVMGPDDKRAELQKIARARAINEKAEKEKEKQAALEVAAPAPKAGPAKKSEVNLRSEEHTSELQSRQYLVCRLLLEKKKNMSTL